MANAEIDDVPALTCQFGCPRQDGKGVLFADPVETRYCPEHFCFLSVFGFAEC